MKFLVDHDVPDAVPHMLRREGHDIVLLRDILSTRSLDSEVMSAGLARGCTIITCNRDDFLQLASAQFEAGGAIAGLIILIRRHTREAECANMAALLRQSGEQGILGNINFA